MILIRVSARANDRQSMGQGARMRKEVWLRTKFQNDQWVADAETLRKCSERLEAVARSDHVFAHDGMMACNQ